MAVASFLKDSSFSFKISLVRTQRPYLTQCQALVSTCNRLHGRGREIRDSQQKADLKRLFEHVSKVLELCTRHDAEKNEAEIANLIKIAAERIVDYQNAYKPPETKKEEEEKLALKFVIKTAGSNDAEARKNLNRLKEQIEKRKTWAPWHTTDVRILTFEDPITMGTANESRCVIEKNADLSILAHRLCISHAQHQRNGHGGRSFEHTISFNLNPHFYDSITPKLQGDNTSQPVQLPLSFTEVVQYHPSVIVIPDRWQAVGDHRCRQYKPVTFVVNSGPTSSYPLYQFWWTGKGEDRDIVYKGELGSLYFIGKLVKTTPIPDELWDEALVPLSKFSRDLVKGAFLRTNDKWELIFYPETVRTTKKPQDPHQHAKAPTTSTKRIAGPTAELTNTRRVEYLTSPKSAGHINQSQSPSIASTSTSTLVPSLTTPSTRDSRETLTNSLPKPVVTAPPVNANAQPQRQVEPDKVVQPEPDKKAKKKRDAAVEVELTDDGVTLNAGHGEVFFVQGPTKTKKGLRRFFSRNK